MNLTFKQAIELYGLYGCQKLASRTRIEYENDIDQLVAFLESQGVHHPAEVNPNHLRAFLTGLEGQGLSRFARRRKMFATRSFFRFLAASYLHFDPAKKLILLAREDEKPRYLTTEEEQALLRACATQPRDAAIIELILHTGIRLSEAANLTVFDAELPLYIIDSKNFGRLHIRGRGKKKRAIDLDFQARRALEKWFSVRPQIENPALFVMRFFQPMGQRAIQRTVEKYLKLAGIFNASVHTLRHTFATHRLAQGADLSDLRETLGHESIQTMTGYVAAARELVQHELKATRL